MHGVAQRYYLQNNLHLFLLQLGYVLPVFGEEEVKQNKTDTNQRAESLNKG